MSRTATRLFAAIAIAGLTTLASAPALAAPPPPGCKPEHGKPAYPPGQCKKAAITDSTATPGQSLTAYSGEGQFDPGSSANAELRSTPKSLGTVTVDSAGAASVTFTVPTDLSTGAHSVVFTGPFFGVNRSVAVNFQVVGAGAGLPLTGFEMGAAALLGVGLLGAGTIAVVSGRRRRLAPLAA